jgi:hypothetical protein
MLHQVSQEEEEGSTSGMGAAVDTGKKLEKLIKEMLVRGGGVKGGLTEAENVKVKDHIGC